MDSLKCFRSIPHKQQESIVFTVAVLGLSSNKANSPKLVPGPMIVRFPLQMTSSLPLDTQKKFLPGSPWLKITSFGPKEKCFTWSKIAIWLQSSKFLNIKCCFKDFSCCLDFQQFISKWVSSHFYFWLYCKNWLYF